MFGMQSSGAASVCYYYVAISRLDLNSYFSSNLVFFHLLLEYTARLRASSPRLSGLVRTETEVELAGIGL